MYIPFARETIAQANFIFTFYEIGGNVIDDLL